MDLYTADQLRHMQRVDQQVLENIIYTVDLTPANDTFRGEHQTDSFEDHLAAYPMLLQPVVDAAVEGRVDAQDTAECLRSIRRQVRYRNSWARNCADPVMEDLNNQLAQILGQAEEAGEDIYEHLCGTISGPPTALGTDLIRYGARLGQPWPLAALLLAVDEKSGFPFDNYCHVPALGVSATVARRALASALSKLHPDMRAIILTLISEQPEKGIRTISLAYDALGVTPANRLEDFTDPVEAYYKQTGSPPQGPFEEMAKYAQTRLDKARATIGETGEGRRIRVGIAQAANTLWPLDQWYARERKFYPENWTPPTFEQVNQLAANWSRQVIALVEDVHGERDYQLMDALEHFADCASGSHLVNAAERDELITARQTALTPELGGELSQVAYEYAVTSASSVVDLDRPTTGSGRAHAAALLLEKSSSNPALDYQYWIAQLASLRYDEATNCLREIYTPVHYSEKYLRDVGSKYFGEEKARKQKRAGRGRGF